MRSSLSGVLGKDASITLMLAALGIAGIVGPRPDITPMRPIDGVHSYILDELELWDDPLRTPNDSQSASRYSTPLESRDLAILVPVHGRSRPEYVENRLRVRYAVQTAMALKGFRPDRTHGIMFEATITNDDAISRIRWEDFADPGEGGGYNHEMSRYLVRVRPHKRRGLQKQHRREGVVFRAVDECGTHPICRAAEL